MLFSRLPPMSPDSGVRFSGIVPAGRNTISWHGQMHGVAEMTLSGAGESGGGSLFSGIAPAGRMIKLAYSSASLTAGFVGC